MKYIYIRGVGRSEKKKGFSDKLRYAINESNTGYSNIAGGNVHKEFIFQEIIESRVDDYFNTAFKKPKWYRFKKMLTYVMRKAVFDYAVDATAYHNFKFKILNDLKIEVGDAEEVTFITHSLGCTIAYDFIEAYPDVNVKTFITLGCNLPFFKLGNNELLNVSCKWVNFYEPNDVLSMPMKPLAAYIVKDVEFNDRSLKGSTVGAHAVYWKNKDLIKMILKELA